MSIYSLSTLTVTNIENGTCPIFYLQLLTSSRDALTCSLTIFVSSRSCARCPPFQALPLTRCLPSGDLGPVDLEVVKKTIWPTNGDA